MNRRISRSARSLACLAAAFAATPGLAQTITYTYDADGQVKSAAYPNGAYVLYGYDAAGNRIQRAVTTNPPPSASSDSILTQKNIAKNFDPRGNDRDLNGNPLTISAKTNGAHGTVVINSGVSLTYTPASNYVGLDTFTYTITDGTSTDTAPVSVKVNGPPVAIDQAVWICPAVLPTTVSINALGGATDPNGDALSVTSATSPATVSNNRVLFSNVGLGTYSATYTISDGSGGSDTANVTASVMHVGTC